MKSVAVLNTPVTFGGAHPILTLGGVSALNELAGNSITVNSTTNNSDKIFFIPFPLHRLYIFFYTEIRLWKDKTQTSSAKIHPKGVPRQYL
jgi:hypothetical protein